MKKYYLLSVLAMGLMASCQEEDIFVKSQMNYSNVVVTASLDESSATRTQLSSEGKVFWSEGDALSIFSSNSAHAKFVLSKGDGTANADFKFESGDLSFGTEDGSNDFGYVGVYPYSESTTISKDASSYMINTVIPTEQTYAENSFGQDASPMVAVDPSLKLSFKNVGSMLVMPLTGKATIVSATLKSSSHNIAGAAKVTVAEESNWIPSVDVTDGASEIVLSCGEGVELSNGTATKFYFVLAPGTYEADDLVVRFYTNDGKYFETTISEENTFKRSKSLTFTAREFEETGIASFVTTEDALKAAITAGKTAITLGANIDLASSVEVKNDLVVNLNNKSIKCKSSDVFVVTAGTLTINGDGLVYGSEDNSSSSCAVWAKESGIVIINGGTYKVGHDEASKATSANWRNDCIYARDNAKITINGGEFAYTGDTNTENFQSDGNRFLLNCRDQDYKAGTCSITVKGGTFHKFNPGATSSENPVASYVAVGYSSVAGEKETYVVKEGIFNETALKAAIANNIQEITLDDHISLSNVININNTVTINLNGKDIIHPNSTEIKYADVFDVGKGGNLTILGQGRVISQKNNSIFASADAKVFLKGGEYYAPLEVVYAQSNAVVTIEGGEYYADVEPAKNSPEHSAKYGHKFTLNLKDGTAAQIIVKGGKFYKYNPAGSESENPHANFVAEGYSSTQDGDNYVVSKEN